MTKIIVKENMHKITIVINENYVSSETFQRLTLSLCCYARILFFITFYVK